MGILTRPNRAAATAEIVLLTGCVVVAVREVNPPNCAVATNKVPFFVTVDAVMVRSIPRLHIRGRDPGRNTGANGVVDVILLEKAGIK